MNIHKPDILRWIALGLLGTAVGNAQILTDFPKPGNEPSLDSLSSKIVMGPVADAYTTERLLFSSGSANAGDFHHDDRKLLEAGGSGGNLEQLDSKYRIPGTGGETDVARLTESILHQIKDEPARIERILEIEIAANPQRVCEIVKAAMNAVEADERQTTLILETVASIAPDSLRLAAQCAIAVHPSSLQSIQSVLARLDPGAGDGLSAKSGKAPSAKPAAPAAEKGDPLDLPRLIIIPPFFPSPDWIPEVSDSDPPLLN